jgi:hypothetical protein
MLPEFAGKLAGTLQLITRERTTKTLRKIAGWRWNMPG